LLYSTFIGGRDSEFALDMGLYDDGSIYLAGLVNSDDFPVTPGAISSDRKGHQEGYFLKLDQTWANLSYSTYIGTVGNDKAHSIVVGAPDIVYVGGFTGGSQFPTTEGAYDEEYNGNGDAFVLKFEIPVIPGAPVILSGTEGDGYVALSWNAPPDIPGYPILNYSIYRGDTANYLTLLETIGDVRNYNDTDVVNGMAYYYAVSAINSDIEGYRSDNIRRVPGAPPTVPLNLTAVPENARIVLDWLPPEDEKGFPIWDYRVYRGTSEEDLSLLNSVDDNTYIDNAVTNGVTYFYSVTAINDRGEGAMSKIVNGTPGAVPSEPIELVAEAGDNVTDLAWQSPLQLNGFEILNYTIFRGLVASDLSIITVLDNVTVFNDTTVENGITYYYAVSATNAKGEGARSSIVNATPGGRPTKPVNLTAVSGDMNVHLSWEDPLDAKGFPITGYKIHRGVERANLTEYVEVGLVNEYEDILVENGRVYQYSVSALNSKGESDMSNIVTANPFGLPAEPENLALESGDGYVIVTWDPPLNDGGSEVFEYNVYQGELRNDLALIQNTSDPSFNHTNLTNGKSYFYMVSAVNLRGEGPKTDVMEVVPFDIPGPVKTLNVTGKADRVLLWWTPPDYDGGSKLTGFIIYRGDTMDTLTTLKMVRLVDTYSDDSVTNGQTYYYAISAKNDIGEGNLSEVLSATPGDIPGPPKGLKVVQKDNKVSITWQAPTDNGGFDAVEFNVYRGTSQGDMSIIATLNGTKFIDKDVEVGKKFYYKVSCVNEKGEGPSTNTVSVDVKQESIRDNLMTPILVIIIIIVILVVMVLALKKGKKKKEIEKEPVKGTQEDTAEEE
jgi:titin